MSTAAKIRKLAWVETKLFERDPSTLVFTYARRQARDRGGAPARTHAVRILQHPRLGFGRGTSFLAGRGFLVGPALLAVRFFRWE